MLTDAQLLLGLSRHLSAYSYSPSVAELDGLNYAGQVLDIAWRLRGSTVSTIARVIAIGVDARVPKRQIITQVLPTMEQLDWVFVERDQKGNIQSVECHVPPATELESSAALLLELTILTDTEVAALTLIRSTTRQPLTKTAALDECSGLSDDAAESALSSLAAVNLVRIVNADDGREVVFNPNVWADDEQAASAALKVEDARIASEVGALLEEVAHTPGLPQIMVTSTEKRWIDFAVSQGLVQRTVVKTSNGAEQRFLFTPHMGRDAFGLDTQDPSGHVRQLVGSMVYASTFSTRNQLINPSAFLRRLIRDGEAGNVPEIGTDYPMLETAGTITVAPGTWGAARKMVLLQTDVAESALQILQVRGSSAETRAQRGVESITDQRNYTHLEPERARLALEAPVDAAQAARLITALRETVGKRTF